MQYIEPFEFRFKPERLTPMSNLLHELAGQQSVIDTVCGKSAQPPMVSFILEECFFALRRMDAVGQTRHQSNVGFMLSNQFGIYTPWSYYSPNWAPMSNSPMPSRLYRRQAQQAIDMMSASERDYFWGAAIHGDHTMMIYGGYLDELNQKYHIVSGIQNVAHMSDKRCAMLDELGTTPEKAYSPDDDVFAGLNHLAIKH